MNNGEMARADASCSLPSQPPKGMVGKQATVAGMLEHIVPQSFVEAAATNEVLQIVFWSIMFGVALTQVPSGPREVMLSWLQALALGKMPSSQSTVCSLRRLSDSRKLQSRSGWRLKSSTFHRLR